MNEIFMVDTGVNTAQTYVYAILQDPMLPKDMRRQVQSLASDIDVLQDDVQAQASVQRRSIQARQLDVDLSGKFRWAIQGLESAIQYAKTPELRALNVQLNLVLRVLRATAIEAESRQSLLGKLWSFVR